MWTVITSALERVTRLLCCFDEFTGEHESVHRRLHVCILLRHLMVDEDTVQRDFCWRQLSNMKQLCHQFYAPGQTQTALETAICDRDNLASAVRFAAQNLVDVQTDNDDEEG